MEDHLDGVVEQDDGEPQARHLTIEDESFRFFQLDDRPALPFHEAILRRYRGDRLSQRLSST